MRRSIARQWRAAEKVPVVDRVAQSLVARRAFGLWIITTGVAAWAFWGDKYVIGIASLLSGVTLGAIAALRIDGMETERLRRIDAVRRYMDGRR